MSVNTDYSAGEKKLTISISGNFDFSVQKAFREAYQNSDEAAAYRVDLVNTDYMDSSALGMLLLLRKHAGGDNADVSLSGANDTVRKILDIAKFDKLFSIN